MSVPIVPMPQPDLILRISLPLVKGGVIKPHPLYIADSMRSYAAELDRQWSERVEAIRAECEQLRADAERYRLLRDSFGINGWPPPSFPTLPWCVRCELEHGMPTNKFIAGSELDAAIDAARSKEKA